ncbi:MAG: Holliday junction branch migration DNA helicase RuvB [Bdellovibrionales bacterium]
MEFDRFIDAEKKPEDHGLEVSLRPKAFAEFPGQDKVKQKLQVFTQAAKMRGEPMDHVLLCGPPGLGKTTLAHILANTMEADFTSTSGPALHRKGDLAAILTSLRPGSVFFIDEIHRLNRDVEEYLYSAMEDYYIDIVTGEGLGARSMRFQLNPFTLVGATTRAGLLKAPFRDRFGIVERLTFYDRDSLVHILQRSAALLNMNLTSEGALQIARRSRGTPRVANRLLRRVRDYADVHGNGQVSAELAEYALNELEVDQLGLDPMDRRILSLILDRFGGGPVGIDTLSAALSEESDTLEEVYEPFLLQEGLLQKTPRGRVITETCRIHLRGAEAPASGIRDLEG